MGEAGEHIGRKNKWYGLFGYISHLSSGTGEIISFPSLDTTVQNRTEQYRTVQYSTVQYRTVQYSTVKYSTVQYLHCACAKMGGGGRLVFIIYVI